MNVHVGVNDVYDGLSGHLNATFSPIIEVFQGSTFRYDLCTYVCIYVNALVSFRTN